MSSEVYYFSGTGNSLVVARDIAARLQANLIPLVTVMCKETIDSEAAVVGVVFPNYYGEPPLIVQEFLHKLNPQGAKYIFTMSTYGGAALDTLRMARRILRSRGVDLSASFGVHMPQNSFPKPKENHATLYAAWERKAQMIAECIRLRKTGTLYDRPLLELLLRPVYPLSIRPIVGRHFRKNSGLPALAARAEHMRAMGKHFRVNSSCTACGVCTQVCPVGNIVVENSQPLWRSQCEHCLACYNWCPHKAIEGGITSEEFHYRHPDVTISDLIRQRRGD